MRRERCALPPASMANLPGKQMNGARTVHVPPPLRNMKNEGQTAVPEQTPYDNGPYRQIRRDLERKLTFASVKYFRPCESIALKFFKHRADNPSREVKRMTLRTGQSSATGILPATLPACQRPQTGSPPTPALAIRVPRGCPPALHLQWHSEICILKSAFQLPSVVRYLLKLRTS